MAFTKVRELGTTGAYAPQMKRATAKLSNGRSVVVFPDANLITANGDQANNIDTIYVYVSGTNHAKTGATESWTTFEYVPDFVSCGPTQRFIGSVAVDSSNNLYVAYVTDDNSIQLISMTGYDGVASWSSVVEQEVVAGNSIATRWRALDMDVTSTGNPIVIGYEVVHVSGLGAYARIYARRNDGTTWIKAHERILVSASLFVRVGGEDVSISCGGTVSSNVVKLLYYATQTATTVDSGDVLISISFNLLTGATNSATTLGAWLPGGFNRGVGSGTRKGWLFSPVNGRWIFANAIGASAPFFEGMMLTDGNYGTPIRNRIGTPPSGPPTAGNIWTVRKLVLAYDANHWAGVTANYMDNRLTFTYAGLGDTSPRTVRALVMRWAAVANGTAQYIDTSGRMWDNAYTGPPPEYTGVSVINSGVIGVYGGANRNLYSGHYAFDTAVMYGRFGAVVSTVEDERERELRLVWEDVFPGPSILSPGSFTSVATNRPMLQAVFQSTQAYMNTLGKIQWQLARDYEFTDDVRTFTGSTAQYESFSAVNGQIPIRTMSYQMGSVDTPLYSGTWYMRVRMVDDLGGEGAWSHGPSDHQFEVSHPPIALPVSPGGSPTINYGSGNVPFTWRFNDPEPSDSQSAYQVIIERLDTGAAVFDTGKVASANRNAVIAIPSDLKDVPLQWRVRLWDIDDVDGPYSDGMLFAVADPPTVTLTSPAQGAVVTTALPVFQWTVTVGGVRTQRAFRITVYDTTVEPAVAVAESGWIFSSDTNYSFSNQILTNNKTYAVAIQVQDNVGLFSSVNREVPLSQLVADSSFESGVVPSGWLGINATLSNTGTDAHRGTRSLQITATAGTTPHADSPVWETSPGQKVRVWGWLKTPVLTAVPANLTFNWFNGGGYVSTFVGEPLALAANTWTFFDVEATVPVNVTHYNVRPGFSGAPGNGVVLLADEIQTNGGGGNITTFDSDWIEPALANPITLSADSFKVTIAWDNTTQDTDFVSWRVYRRYMATVETDWDFANTASTWVLLHETSEEGPTYTYRDYVAPLGKTVDYVVVQMVDRFGSLIESDITSWSSIVQPGDRYYFIPEIPMGSIASFEAGSVNADSFTDDVETETIQVIGRGRQVQVGDDLGYSGSLSIQLLNPATARRDREFMEALASSHTGNVYMKTPFGDVHYLRLGPVATNRLPGFGHADIAAITIPYTVVFQEVPPATRTV